MPTLQYTYNGDGQRVQTVESGVTKKQVWDEENILLETDGSDVTQVVYTQEPAGYGNLLSQRRGSTTSYYLFDALGSTRRLASGAGSTTDTYEYRAYGELFSSTGSTINVFRWVGELGYYYDVDREAYYVRARHYSPKQGRWISQDPLGFEGSEWNLHEYVHSQPSVHVDPSGMFLGWGYGHYCGYSRAASCPPGSGPRPLDAVDAACERHDCCLATWLDCWKLTSCNSKLCQEAKDAYESGCRQSHAGDKKGYDACIDAAEHLIYLVCWVYPWDNPDGGPLR